MSQMASVAPTAVGVFEGQPTPCFNCGALMTMGAAAGLHMTPELSCHFCGAREVLPADAAQRVQHLRLRLIQLQRAREAREAPLRTFAMLKQSMLPGMVIMVVICGIQLAGQWGRLNGTPTLLMLAPVSIITGMIAGWLGMLAAFRALVRPLMQARPATQPGFSARCRSCGGDLPLARAEKVACRYCQAENLLDQKLTSNVSALLQREAELYHQQAQGKRPDPNAFDRPAQAFYVFGLAGAALSFGVLAVVLHFVSS